MKAIFIVGTGHQAYQKRPRCGPQDGADAFKRHILQIVQTHACKTIAEEMSTEAPGGCRTVGHEVAKEENLSHILCDPTCLERQALGISKDNTPLDIAKREDEWLRRLVYSGIYPVLFLCGAHHEAHPKTTLYGVVFRKLNGPLLTSAPQSPPGSKAALR
jgi:hypothetical protein